MSRLQIAGIILLSLLLSLTLMGIVIVVAALIDSWLGQAASVGGLFYFRHKL